MCHTMRIQIYRNYVYYLKTSGTCIVVLGGCWFLYHLRRVSRIVRSTVNENVLDLERAHPQYIYIDDPRFKDIFVFRKDDLDGPALEKSQSLGDILMNWWEMYDHKIAYKLLYMAQHGNKNERYKAVTALSSLSRLKDWQYVLERVHSLLLRLNALCDNTHPCLTQFLSQMFKDIHRDGFVFDHDLTSTGLSVAPVTVWDKDLFKSCVRAIYHHSSVERYSKHLVDAGALPILTAIRKICSDDVEMFILLAGIISNVSLHPEYLEKIFESDDNARNQTTDYLSTMIDDDRPQEFFKDLARDLQLHEWKKIGQDFEVILDDCPQNTNCRACGPYFCRG